MSNDFQSFLQTKGIISQRSCSYTPQQNGVTERKNRHLLDVVWTLLIETSVPLKFWVEALTTATYLINHLPSQILGLESPYTYTNLHTFGCVCFMHLPPPHRNKLSAQSIRCAFLGYSVNQKGYLCFDLNTNQVHISRNVVFFENQCFFPLSSSSATSLASLPSFNDTSHIPSVQVDRFKPHLVYRRRLPVLPPSTNVPPCAPSLPPSVDSKVTDLPPLLPPLRHSSRVSIPPDRFGFNPSMPHIPNIVLSATLNSIKIPTSYSQAAKESCWQQAMLEELSALDANHTSDIVDCPSSVTPLECR
ncbi:hypothetical protein NC652_027915 [Populus alba x Populus x berolinensis]|nr:hypothetical protein NC652_027915 [Populus alba x Populus x berolinensis]